MEVGTAKPARLHSDDYLAVRRGWFGHVRDPKRMAESLEDRSLHSCEVKRSLKATVPLDPLAIVRAKDTALRRAPDQLA